LFNNSGNSPTHIAEGDAGKITVINSDIWEKIKRYE